MRKKKKQKADKCYFSFDRNRDTLRRLLISLAAQKRRDKKQLYTNQNLKYKFIPQYIHINFSIKYIRVNKLLHNYKFILRYMTIIIPWKFSW